MMSESDDVNRAFKQSVEISEGTQVFDGDQRQIQGALSTGFEIFYNYEFTRVAELDENLPEGVTAKNTRVNLDTLPGPHGTHPHIQ